MQHKRKTKSYVAEKWTAFATELAIRLIVIQLILSTVTILVQLTR